MRRERARSEREGRRARFESGGWRCVGAVKKCDGVGYVVNADNGIRREESRDGTDFVVWYIGYT
jgi:hypothetical protein